MKKFYKQKNRGRQTLSLSKGFTLVETLVAISIFTMSLLGLMSVMASGIADTGYAKQKMTATYLAQEGIEYARNQRDTDILDSGKGWSYFRDNDLDLSSLPAFSNSNFTRSIEKNTILPDKVEITSTVIWHQGSGDYHITFSEDLFNWFQ